MLVLSMSPAMFVTELMSVTTLVCRVAVGNCTITAITDALNTAFAASWFAQATAIILQNTTVDSLMTNATEGVLGLVISTNAGALAAMQPLPQLTMHLATK